MSLAELYDNRGQSVLAQKISILSVLIILLASCAPKENGDKITAFLALTFSEKEDYVFNSYFRSFTSRINAARVCLAHYRDTFPEADAMVEAKKIQPRFFYKYYSGYASGYEGTGLPGGCDPDINASGVQPGWQSLNQYGSVVGDGCCHIKIIQECNTDTYNYALRFNRRLAALRPDRVGLACKNRPTPADIRKWAKQERLEIDQRLARERKLQSQGFSRLMPFIDPAPGSLPPSPPPLPTAEK